MCSSIATTIGLYTRTIDVIMPMKNVNMFETILIISTSMRLKGAERAKILVICEVNMGSIGPNLPSASFLIEGIFHNLYVVVFGYLTI